MSIRVSERHGVNPSVMLCFYCQESMGVALMGRIKGDKQAPREAVFDHEPCDTCKGHMEKGIILISVRNEDEGNENPYRTGGWVVITDEAIERMIEPEDVRQSILTRRIAFVPDAAWEMLGLPGKEDTSNGNETKTEGSST